MKTKKTLNPEDFSSSEKLRMIGSAIEGDPDDYYQSSFGDDKEADEFYAHGETLQDSFSHAGEGVCGTPCCVAGWAIALFGDPNDIVVDDEGEVIKGIGDYALDLLGIELPISFVENRNHPLFFARWPEDWLYGEKGDHVLIQEDALSLGDARNHMVPEWNQAVRFLYRYADAIDNQEVTYVDRIRVKYDSQ